MSDWSQSLIPQSRQDELDHIAGQWSPDDIRSMTHQPEQPNPAAPYLESAPRIASGFQHGGLTGAFPQLHQSMPSWLDAVGRIFQSQAAHDALSTANVGGLPLIEAIWTPAELSKLKMMYGKNIDPYTLAALIKQYLPGRSIQSIRAKAFQLGLKRPEIPPYVRQPGSPSIANDPARVAQVEKLMNKNLTFDQMAMEMGDVSPRTLRRYINENLKQRLVRGGPNQPSMPSFKFQKEGSPAGDPEFEKAIAAFMKLMQ